MECFPDMKPLAPWLRTGLTLAILLLVLGAIYGLWIRYQVDPVTRDGKVRADVVPVAADVGGLVTEVDVHDNQPVRQGQRLFVIDPSRYRMVLDEAEADVRRQQIELAQAVREDRRNRTMTEVVATESTEQGHARVEAMRATLALLTSRQALARLNLQRTEVRASVDGVVGNVGLLPGTYLHAGDAAMALVSLQSLRVEGYFEETKLPAVHVGDRARIHLMGVAEPIDGHVQSLAAGVQDRERAAGESQLANVNPSFTWVRLAQRVPVRIVVDRIPPGVRLLPGLTASIQILPRPQDRTVRRSLPW